MRSFAYVGVGFFAALALFACKTPNQTSQVQDVRLVGKNMIARLVDAKTKLVVERGQVSKQQQYNVEIYSCSDDKITDENFSQACQLKNSVPFPTFQRAAEAIFAVDGLLPSTPEVIKANQSSARIMLQDLLKLAKLPSDDELKALVKKRIAELESSIAPISRSVSMFSMSKKFMSIGAPAGVGALYNRMLSERERMEEIRSRTFGTPAEMKMTQRFVESQNAIAGFSEAKQISKDEIKMLALNEEKVKLLAALKRLDDALASVPTEDDKIAREIMTIDQDIKDARKISSDVLLSWLSPDTMVELDAEKNPFLYEYWSRALIAFVPSMVEAGSAPCWCAKTTNGLCGVFSPRVHDGKKAIIFRVEKADCTPDQCMAWYSNTQTIKDYCTDKSGRLNLVFMAPE